MHKVTVRPKTSESIKLLGLSIIRPGVTINIGKSQD